MALVNEPYNVGRPGWRCDSSGRAAVGVFRDGLTLADVEIGDGYVAATVGGALRIYSCYASPAFAPAEFERFLENLEVGEASYRGTGVDLIDAGDFNARPAVWWDHLTDRRGHNLCALADSLGLIAVNSGGGSRFSSGVDRADGRGKHE